MYLKVSYDQEFDDLMMYLKGKYPKKLFDIDGIGDQLDLSKFSKKFFSSNVTADASIDANANVDDVSVIVYNTELPKPFFKLNSYYILWKQIKKNYTLLEANDIVEKQLVGDIYIHDFHGIAAGESYSYHPHTTIILDINGDIRFCTMEDLFEMFEENVEDRGTYEEINFFDMQYRVKIDFPKYHGNTQNLLQNFIYNKISIKVLDENDVWTKVTRVLRHKKDCDLLKITTKNGRCTIVTENHPVILEDGSTKCASELVIGDKLKVKDLDMILQEKVRMEEDFAYLMGFWIGDGWSNKHKSKKIKGSLGITQKDLENHKVYSIAKKYFRNASLNKYGKLIFGGTQFYTYFCKELHMGKGSQSVKLPSNILQWNEKAITALISGVIDSDGCIGPEGRTSIRVASFAMVNQIADILRLLGIDDVYVRTIKHKFYPSTEKKITTKMESFMVSFRAHSTIFEWSDKVRANKESCNKIIGEEGRWETNEIHEIEVSTNTKDFEWVYDITTESGQFYSQGLIQHNCYNYSTYDVMINGLPMIKKIKSVPPKYLYSFKSQLEQFVVIASNSTLGATGLADLLITMSYYVKNILDTKKDAHFMLQDEEACWNYIKENLVSFIYTINQPLRANQSPFTNISIYDRNFLETLKDGYIFPDGSTPDMDIVQQLQEMFLNIMNEEMNRTPITFPVTTACLSVDDENNIQDEEFLNFIAEKNRQYGFINIYCGNSSTLSSCCRLRSDTNNEYFNSFGSGSTKIGSLGVVSVNFPRLAIKAGKDKKVFMESLKDMVEVTGRINHAKRQIVKKRIENGNLPLYGLGFMDLGKQYSTLGVNGFNECLEEMGFDILTKEGQEFALEIIDVINKENDKLEKRYNAPHNCEQVPGENMSIKMAEKDRLFAYQDKYEIYSNQFIPLITNADMLDRIKIQGILDKHFSGGAICHLNVDSQIDNYKDVALLIKNAAKMGVIYFAINYNIQECEEGHMSVGKEDICVVCGKEIVNNFTRVVGFLTNTKNWHKVRRDIDYPYRKFYKKIRMGDLENE
jgi:ribonucleoside-triphosphate reductase